MPPHANHTQRALTRLHDLLRARSTSCVLCCSRMCSALIPRAFPVQEGALLTRRAGDGSSHALPLSPPPLASLPSIPPSLRPSLPPFIPPYFHLSLGISVRAHPLVLPARSALGVAFMGPSVPSSPVIVFLHSFLPPCHSPDSGNKSHPKVYMLEQFVLNEFFGGGRWAGAVRPLPDDLMVGEDDSGRFCGTVGSTE